VLRWTEGNFQIDFNGKSSQETTTLNTQGLLMEGLRLLTRRSGTRRLKVKMSSRHLKHLMPRGRRC